jgi:hypothetical protein
VFSTASIQLRIVPTSPHNTIQGGVDFAAVGAGRRVIFSTSAGIASAASS